MKYRTVRHPVSYTEMAGWLFADLLLGIAVIGLASQAALPMEDLPEPSPTPTPVVDRVLNLRPYADQFSVNGSLTSASSRQQLRETYMRSGIAKLNRGGKEAGFVMIFAGGPDGRGSTQVSEIACSVLKSTYPNLATRQTICRPFIYQGLTNKIKIEVYTYKE